MLLRAGVVVYGSELVRRRRGPAVRSGSLTDGPGKLSQALAVDRRDDGVDVCEVGSGLWLCDDGLTVDDNLCRRGPRVGVGYAGEAASWPLRFRVVGA